MCSINIGTSVFRFIAIGLGILSCCIYDILAGPFISSVSVVGGLGKFGFLLLLKQV